MQFAITAETSVLREATGYWSGRKVYFNPTNHVVLLDQNLTAASLSQVIEQAYEEHLEGAIAAHIERHLATRNTDLSTLLAKPGGFRNYFLLCRLLPAFHLSAFSSPKGAATWPRIGAWLTTQFPDDPDAQKQFLVDQIALVARQGGLPIKLNALGPDWLQLGNVDLRRLLLCRIPDIQQLLAALGTLGQVSIPGDIRKNLSAVAEHNRPALRCCEHYGLSTPQLRTDEDGVRLVSLSNAADLVLVLLARKQRLLLPRNWARLVSAMRVVEPHWPWDDLEVSHRHLLTALLKGTTLEGIADLPADARLWLDGIPLETQLNVLLKPLVETYQREHDHLAPWPLAKLNLRKIRRDPQALSWTPAWIAKQDYGAPWVEFAQVYWQLSDAGGGQKKRAFRDFLPWAAKERGFASPSSIQITDLRDPHHPGRRDTFAAYLKLKARRDRTEHHSWIAAAAAFERVVNALKVSPNPLLSLPQNPFRGLDSPVKVARSNKTTRRRLPAAIHEAMIEVLLEPDADGNPTYAWIRDTSRWDWFDRCDPLTGVTEPVWCPSRAACLALLLVLPLRRKQARWLDRGLMDEKIWDMERDQYLPNTHPLINWRYPDGQSQLERYGRPTGVLQPIFDPLVEKEELGIFINTNKTQMWDPSNKRGYEIPWPSGRPLMPDAPELAENAKWLERPYAILRQQLEWQASYNPTPVPVDFIDLTSDAEGVNERFVDRMPSCTPVFADMSCDDYRDDRNHTMIHLPVRGTKLGRLFNALAVETEHRLREEGRAVTLTAESSESKLAHHGRVCLFDLHSLRVAGISRLIEMGVPIQIVQEFIAGHMTAVMTYLYKKLEPGFLRQKLLEALDEAGILGDWQELREPLAARPTLWVFNRRFADHRSDDLLDTYAGWKLVPGGICPLGGTGCDIGQPIDVEDDDKSVKGHYAPVVGGCGNCRFFSTGPAFLVQQAQVANEIMLECRVLGRDRKALYDRLAELDWGDDPQLGPGRRQKLTLEREILREQIRSIDQRMEPMILEWFNRYVMFEESKKLMADWRELVTTHNRPGRHSLVLVAGATPEDVREQLQIRLEQAGDFSLIRNILEGAKLRGGLAKASSLAKDKCCEFMDRILRTECARHLLLDIPEERLRNEAAYLMASLAEQLVGDRGVQEALDSRQALPLDDRQRTDFMNWTAQIIANAQRGPKLAKMEDLLPKLMAIEP